MSVRKYYKLEDLSKLKDYLMSKNNWSWLNGPTAEYAFWVKTICDLYDFKTEELKIIRGYYPSNSVKPLIKKIKTLPVYYDIPSSMVPKKDLSFLDWLTGRGKLRVDISTHPDRILDPMIPEKLGEYSLAYNNKTIKFWRVCGNYDSISTLISNDCILIHQSDLKFFYRAIKSISRAAAEVKKPILPDGMLKEIYDNSIGFLLKSRTHKDSYKKYKIPYKRGILLAGSPGSGKTLTCRWLRELCKANGLQHKVVSMEEYRNALSRGRVNSCFQFQLPMQNNSGGIIFFDDLDIMLKDRKTGNTELSPFLTALDGIDPIEGVVSVFTTNYIAELDEAFVRPGRIDLFMTFSLPDTKLRKLFIDRLFDNDIKTKIDIESLVDRTSDYSFAEIEEIRKLLCISLINGKDVNVDQTMKTFELHRKQFSERMNLGFKLTEPNPYDIYYERDDDGTLPTFPWEN